jgi:hypothetical protein
MVSQAFSSLKRLVAWRAQPRGTEVTQVPEEERRIAVRYPCDLETTCQPAHAPYSRCLSATVQNISRGGIGLRVKEQFEPGSLLSVEMPAGSETAPFTVLACVVHATAQADGDWALGCTFASELSAEDLKAFGAQRLKPAPPDQRTWIRFPCETRAAYRLARDADAEARPAQVVDISASGVGLLVPECSAVGVLLNLKLQGVHQPEALTILACVVRVTPHDADQWVWGCNFIRELGEHELRPLV